MQVLSGICLIGASFGLLIWGAATMRSASPSGLARKPFAAEMLAILLIAVFAGGAGLLIDFITGLPRAEAYGWTAGLVVGLPVAMILVWRFAGISERMAQPALPGGIAPPANDQRAARRGTVRKRAA